MQKDKGRRGELTVVLLPGLDGTGRLFDRFVAAAPEGFAPAVVAYPHEGAQTYEALTRQVEARLPQDVPFVLVAESFSGPVAVKLAAAQPVGLRALVLVASFAWAPTPFPISEGAAQQLLRVPKFPWMATVPLLGAGASRELRAEVARAIASVPRSALAARLHAVSRVDVRRELERVAVPVLYLRATADWVVGRRHGEEVHRLARHGAIAGVEAPHLVMQAAPEACWRAIEALVAQDHDIEALSS